jgi:hypothetical protein
MRNLFIALALGSAAMPASAATVLFDTGYKIEKAAINRPVNTTTTLLAQFNLAHMSTLDTVQNYGRVVTAGTALYSVYSDAGNKPGALLYSATKALHLPPGSIGSAFRAELDFEGANITGSVSVKARAISLRSFAARRRCAGARRLLQADRLYRDQQCDLSWRISGATIAAAVPEPATWGMMILGFGLVGGVIRSTRRRQGAVLAAA